MQTTVVITVLRDDGTELRRTEHVGNDSRWVRGQRRRLTRQEMRKDLDARVKAALNATMGGQR